MVDSETSCTTGTQRFNNLKLCAVEQMSELTKPPSDGEQGFQDQWTKNVALGMEIGRFVVPN